jgi:Sortase domain
MSDETSTDLYTLLAEAEPPPAAAGPRRPAPARSALPRPGGMAVLGRAACVGAACLLSVAVTLVVRPGPTTVRVEVPVPVRAAPRPAAVAPTAPRTTRSTPTLPPPPPANMGLLRPAPRPPRGRLSMRHEAPVSLEVPSVGIESDLVDLQLDPGGALQAPADWYHAGWYAGGPYPGDGGGPPAVIAGHVDSYTGPAVFFRIRDVQPGEVALVHRVDGSTARFLIYRVAEYPKNGFPAEAVYAPTRRAEIRLITCGGEFDTGRRSYLDNFVVFGALDDPSARPRRGGG